VSGLQQEIHWKLLLKDGRIGCTYMPGIVVFRLRFRRGADDDGAILFGVCVQL
jgi:hypothetical protein